jgi:hypothetical protein
MIITVIDGDTSWKFDSVKESHEVIEFFNDLGIKERTFENMELKFVEDVTLEQINKMFEKRDGEDIIVEQILTLKPLDNGNS